MIFLIHYDRESSRLVEVRSYPDSRRADASASRMELEIAMLGKEGQEIVVLEAQSEESLHKSHARYFSSLEELQKKRVDFSEKGSE